MRRAYFLFSLSLASWRGARKLTDSPLSTMQPETTYKLQHHEGGDVVCIRLREVNSSPLALRRAMQCFLWWLTCGSCCAVHAIRGRDCRAYGNNGPVRKGDTAWLT